MKITPAIKEKKKLNYPLWVFGSDDGSGYGK